MSNKTEQLSSVFALDQSHDFASWPTENLLDYKDIWTTQKEQADPTSHFAINAGRVLSRVEFELEYRMGELTVDNQPQQV